MHSLLHGLLLRAEQADPITLSIDQIQHWLPAELDFWIRSGVLVPARPAEELVCRQCADQPIDRVVWISPREGQQPQAYLPCPTCGPVAIATDRLRQWRLDLSRLWEEIFAAAGIDVQLRELVPARLWGIGKCDLSDRGWHVFVGRGLHKPRAAELLRGTRFSAQSILFVPAKLPPPDGGFRTLPVILCLRDVVTWNDQKIGFHVHQIEQQLSIKTPPNLSRTLRPVRKRAARASNIEVLSKLLKEHVEAAWDYAQTTANAGKAKLLPRPSQRDLAKLAGINEMAASRCFHDAAARELRILWELAGDLERLLALPSASSSRTRRR
ncbi:MAG: hypothetical protein L0Z50_05125 [Verrucomicrobiales bacterium]|nr:hypothetical protein [Verrucomicrobiales bacterium]